MNLSPSHDDILDDDSLAPLKRNHACFQCKKRKVKCDGTKPACAPCMRSHAHALRNAQRNKTLPPSLICTWADSDSPEPEEAAHTAYDAPVQQIKTSPVPGADAKKKSVEVKKPKGSLVGGKSLEREKEKRRDEEKETLLARIAELESRLAGLSPSDTSPNVHQHRQASSSASLYASPESRPSEISSAAYTGPSGSGSGSSGFQQAWVADATTTSAGIVDGMDFSNLFMVPSNWPRSLPSPFLLDHLVEVFFTHAPQMSRMIHRASFMTRLQLPPTHEDFPHPSLLHAICAYASSYTAWVNNLPPESLEEAVENHKALYGTLDGIEDFGLAQAEAAQRAIGLSTQSCLMQAGNVMVEICQAHIMLADLYFTKGMPMQGWIVAGTAPRLLKALEIMNKNKHPRYKEPLVGEPADSVDREERLATVWMAFIMDAGFTLNSYWNGAMDLDEVLCPLPISYSEFRGRDSYAPPNPQSAHSPDMLAHHPVADSFVLVAKASTLISRVAKWLRKWNQRDMVTGDEMTGLRWPSFTALVNDIYVFQASVPSAMKNIFRILDAGSTTAFDANVLLVHILPSVALCVLYEPFTDFEAPPSLALEQMQRNCESVVGILHLIPSNLDVTLIMTSTLTFCLYTVGRLMANLVQRNSEMQNYALAVRTRADLHTIQNILNRYGQKHALGHWMSSFIDSYLTQLSRGNKASPVCIKENMASERERRRAEAGNANDATVAAAAAAYFSTPSSTVPMTSNAQRHAYAATTLGQKIGMPSSSNCSSTSEFTPPSLNTITPPGGANIQLDQYQSGTTPDGLDFSAHLNYGGDAMAQRAFFKVPGMMSAEGQFQSQGQVPIDADMFSSVDKSGQVVDGRMNDGMEMGTGMDVPTLEEIFAGQAHAGYAVDASKIVWGGT